MKIKILPEFHLNKTADDIEKEFKPFYTGNKKSEEFIVNNTLYIAAFFVPMILFIIIMQYLKFAPFGSNSMFVIDGSINNLPVLTQTIAQIRSHSFHLFSIANGLNGESLSTFLYYLASPFTLITLFFDQVTAIGLLSIFTILRISLSAPIFLYYLTHREIGRRGSKYDPTLLIFAFGYALSSYALVQYNDFMFLDIFMLFPLIMLGMERIIVGKKASLFYITMTFALFSNYLLGITVLLFLLLFYFIYDSRTISEKLLSFPKFFGYCLLSIATAAITVFPGMYGYYLNYIKPSSIDTPSAYNDIYNLFLKHFFFDSPSYEKVAFFGSNLYVGSFLIILFFLYFLNNTLTLGSRIKHFLFFLFLICTLNHSSLNYFFHLGSTDESSFLNYAFIYLFFLVILCFDTIYRIRDISLVRVILSFASPIGLAFFSMNRANPLPNYQSVNYTIDLLIAFAILITLYRLGSIKKVVFLSLVTYLTIIEIFANTFQYSISASLEEVSISSVLTPETTEENPYAGSISEGRSEVFNNMYSMDENTSYLFSRQESNILKNGGNAVQYNAFADSFAALKYLYVEKENSTKKIDSLQYKKIAETANYDIYENKYAFPTAFFTSSDLSQKLDTSDQIAHTNAIAKVLGSKEDLFTEASQDINAEISMPDTAKIDVMGNNLYGFSKHYSAEFDEIDVQRNYRISYKFTPNQSGSLYTYQSDIAFFDTGKTGKEYTFSHFEPLDNDFDMIEYFNVYLLNDTAMAQLSESLNKRACTLSYSGLSTITTTVDASENGSILTILPYSEKYKVLIDGAESTYSNFENRVYIPVEKGSHHITIQYKAFPFVFGIILSLFGISFSLYLLVFRNRLGRMISQKTALIFHSIVPMIVRFVSDNRVYFLTFAIPFITYLIAMINYGCAPFGQTSLFTDDGIQASLPNTIDSILASREGIGLHTWFGAGGRSSWVNSSWIYALLSVNAINTFIPFYTVFKLALSGVSLIFYLTHRLKGKKADKGDYRLIICGIMYSMCNYMLLMLNNYGWYTGYILFPLVLLGMDYLMIKGKKRYFIFLLALTISNTYYIAMFVCFYLVLNFFTYHFSSWKDFIKKGFIFALSGLSMMALQYTTIFGTISAISSSTYGQEYAADTFAFPKSYFFSSWSYIIKQMMIFPDTFTISWNEGDVNLYFGILPIFLIVIYLFNRKVRLADKIRFLIPFGILFISLNYSVLNFIFNGLHYQHGVPNRYVFLLVLVISVASYDCLLSLEDASLLTYLLSFGLTAGCFIYSLLSSDKEVTIVVSFGVSVLLLVLYLSFGLLTKYLNRKRHVFTILLIGIFVAELFVNGYITITNSTLSSASLSYVTPAIDYLTENTNYINTLERVSVRNPICQNYAMVSRVKSNQIFAAGTITNFQQSYGTYTGNSTGDNVITTICSSSLIGDSIGGNRYLVISDISQSELAGDLGNYKYVAQTDHNFILENQYCFPFGYYLPESIIEDQLDSRSVSDVWQTISYDMLDTDEMLITPYPLYNNDVLSDEDKQEIDYFTGYTTKDNKYMLKIHLKAPKTGELYTQFSDFQYLGYHEQGDIVDFEFDATDYHTTDFPSIMTMCVIDKNVFYQLYDKIMEAPLTVTAFTSDTVDGTIEMPEDGVINFSMPYDPSWEAYIDGEKVETYAHANAFFAIKANQGQHNIHLQYVVHQNNKSIMIHRISWITFLLLCLISSIVIWKKKNQYVTTDNTSNKSETDADTDIN